VLDSEKHISHKPETIEDLINLFNLEK